VKCGTEVLCLLIYVLISANKESRDEEDDGDNSSVTGTRYNS